MEEEGEVLAMLKVKEWAAVMKVYLGTTKIACFFPYFIFFFFLAKEQPGDAPFQAGKTETSENSGPKVNMMAFKVNYIH